LKEAIEKAINAGVDVLLFSGNIPGQPPLNSGDLVQLIMDLIKEGKVSSKSINASYQRIMKLKNMNQ
jgi:beta-glucosidase-like glycosyl hydrolase